MTVNVASRRRKFQRFFAIGHFTKYPPGTKENPLSTEAVSAKTRDLMAPVLGADRAEKLIAQINTLESLGDICELRSLFTV